MILPPQLHVTAPFYHKTTIQNSPSLVLMGMFKEDLQRLNRAAGIVAVANEISRTIPKAAGYHLSLAAHYHGIGASRYLDGNYDFTPLRSAMWATSVGLPHSVVRALFEVSGARALAQLDPTAYQWYNPVVNPQCPSPVSMYLTYCDLRVDSTGGIVTLPTRCLEMIEHYGSNSSQAEMVRKLIPYFQSVVKVVESHACVFNINTLGTTPSHTHAAFH